MSPLPEYHIWNVSVPEEEKLLHKKTVPFNFSSMSYKEIAELIRRMRMIMRKANGIGLAVNQIGLPFRMFVAEVPSENGSKFYAIFNPKIEKRDPEKMTGEEGCLSVPGVYGDMTRSAKIVLAGQNAKGRPVKIKAWGLLARVFQHEVDHLDGTLFIDKCKHIYKASNLISSTQ
jgi:peptide deformylase